MILLGMAREGSQRMNDKMFRPFGNTTLFDIYVEKLDMIAEQTNTFSHVVLALSKKDKTLWNIAKRKGKHITIQERNNFSIGEATEPADLFHYLDNYDEKHVMRVNGCFPFLSAETIDTCAHFFNAHNFKTMTCVKERNNWFWNPQTNKPLTLTNKTFTTTQQSQPLYESVHAFHILNRKDILNNILWNLKKDDPYLFVVPDCIEYLDIDTETEFQICEAVWKVYEELWKKQ